MINLSSIDNFYKDIHNFIKTNNVRLHFVGREKFGMTLCN